MGCFAAGFLAAAAVIGDSADMGIWSGVQHTSSDESGEAWGLCTASSGRSPIAASTS